MMRVLLLTPPFTQINTPYPATAFLKRFLTGKGITVRQLDLGINLFLRIFSREGLEKVFDQVQRQDKQLGKHSRSVFQKKEHYLSTIETVIRFLQNRQTGQAYAILQAGFLPKGNRFQQTPDLDHLFGSIGILDKASYYSTLYLEELSDFIRAELSPDFGFSRYAERLALAAVDFDTIQTRLDTDVSWIDHLLKQELSEPLLQFKPDLVGISIPFPGCLIGALQCCKIIKQNIRSLPIVLGGGYVSTELRGLKDPRLFSYTDYVVLDQGEQPLLNLIEALTQGSGRLLRTFSLQQDEVVYHAGTDSDAPFSETGFPDYSDLDLNRYLSLIEIPNQMHRLWNDGRWNKLVIAKGCYWHRCAFCDVTLDYIKNYQTIPVAMLVDRVEQLLTETGQSGFHFVDEAAPPSILKRFALELLRRKLVITWWTNIRFEDNFTSDLCILLAKSGCIAVSGGLETVSERLLKLMNKGVSIPQAVEVLGNLTKAGILVHAYLMYGFPTQTAQETVDSLEIVRQLFKFNLIHSCYWHRFALTAHSLIAQDPMRFKVKITGPTQGKFAWNDLEHADPTGCDHDLYAHGLEKAAFNYMFANGLEFRLAEWFDVKVPQTTIANNFVHLLQQYNVAKPKQDEHKLAIWIGNKPHLTRHAPKTGKMNQSTFKLEFPADSQPHRIHIDPKHADWIEKIMPRLTIGTKELLTLKQLSADYEDELRLSFLSFQQGEVWRSLRRYGLLIV